MCLSFFNFNLTNKIIIITRYVFAVAFFLLIYIYTLSILIMNNSIQEPNKLFSYNLNKYGKRKREKIIDKNMFKNNIILKCKINYLKIESCVYIYY